MGRLEEKLLDPEVRPAVAADCVRLVEEEVAAKKGVSGMVVKTGFKAFRAVKPGIVPAAVDGLLDDFIAVLGPYYEEYEGQDTSVPFSAWLSRRADQVAGDLLQVTDAVAAKSANKTLIRAYNGMRKTARSNVAAAVPGMGRIVEKHMA